GAGFLKVLRARIANLGVGATERESAIERAIADTQFSTLAALDAATRMLDALVATGGVSKGQHACRLLTELTARPGNIPALYWSARPDPNSPDDVLVKGAVMIRISGRASSTSAEDLSTELAAALKERRPQPIRDLWNAVRKDSGWTPPVLAAALAVASATVVFQAILFRGMFDIGRDLSLAGQ